MRRAGSNLGFSLLIILMAGLGSVACHASDIDLLTEADSIIYGGKYPGGAGDFSGWDIATGDVDGDGKQDLLISAIYADGPDDTRWSTMDMYLIFGRELGQWDASYSGPDEADVIFYGGYNPLNGDSNWPGWDVACGDIDGDGFDDIAFCGPHVDGPAGDRNATGGIYIYYGRPRGDWEAVYDSMGEVGPAADIEVYGADDNDSIGGRDLAGSLGSNVSKSLELADVTGDGKAEIIVGAVYADGPGNVRNSCGDVYIVFGNTRPALTSLITLNPSDPGRHGDVAIFGGNEVDFFGFCLAVGDFDGDTVGDLAVGALYSDGPAGNTRNGCGDAWVFFGQEAGLWNTEYDIANDEYDRWLQGRAENGRAAYRLAAGDLDGDARDDLVISTPHNRTPIRPKAGEHQVFFGLDRAMWPTVIDLNLDADVWFQGRDNTDVWGTVGVERFEIGCDASLGDVDGDGREDLLLGAKFGDGPHDDRFQAGEAILVLGRDQAAFEPVYDLQTYPGIIQSNIWGQEMGVTGDVYHYDAAGHGVILADLTGDGTCDIIVAAPFADAPGNVVPEAGETYIVFSDGVYPTPLATQTPTGTPSPRATATYSPTDSPTGLLTATATASLTETASPTPTATGTDTPTPSPTVTLAELEITLMMPATAFGEGDFCLLDLEVSNPGSQRETDLYVLLDVAGQYFSYPSWGPISGGLDFQPMTIAAGDQFTESLIPQFTMPAVSPFGPLYFYAAMFEAGTLSLDTLASNGSLWEFFLE